MKRTLRIVPDAAPLADTTDVLTLLIADVRGYTRFTQEQGDETMISEGIERASAENLNLTLISWLRVRGMVLSQQRRWEEAAQAFRESVSRARTVPYPYAEARTLHEWGRIHAHQENKQRAIEHLRAALGIFERLGAQEDARRIEQTMAEVSRGSEM